MQGSFFCDLTVGQLRPSSEDRYPSLGEIRHAVLKLFKYAYAQLIRQVLQLIKWMPQLARESHEVMHASV